MAHVEKYAKHAIGALTKHYERRRDPDGNYYKFGNENIDKSRTHLNYNLAPEREISQVQYIHKRIQNVRVLNRADVKIMCSCVVTLPEFKINDNCEIDDEQAERLFFERCYQFLEKRFGGEKNIISSYVHRDETTPHMHFAFIPIVPDKKRGGEKVSAKEVVTRANLKSLHTDLEEYLASFEDVHYEILNSKTRDGNKTIAELKSEQRIEKINELDSKINDLNLIKNHLEQQIELIPTSNKFIKQNESLNEINIQQRSQIELLFDMIVDLLRFVSKIKSWLYENYKRFNIPQAVPEIVDDLYTEKYEKIVNEIVDQFYDTNADLLQRFSKNLNDDPIEQKSVSKHNISL